MKLWHTTDWHIGGEHTDALRVHVAALKAQMGEKDWLLVTGDLTDNGSLDEYALALELLNPFSGQLLLCPGNHDYGRLGNFYEAKAEKRWKGLVTALTVPSTAVVAGWRIVTLDSCLKTYSFLDFAQGRVGSTQLFKLCSEFRKAKVNGEKVIVALHHDPLQEVWVERLQDRDELFEECYGEAEFVLCGHSHREYTHRMPRGIGTTIHAEPAFYDSRLNYYIIPLD